MRLTIAISSFILFISQLSLAQDLEIQNSENRKGRLYFYWGWNTSSYSRSDIQFKGDTYNFTLQNVVGKDRQTTFSINTFLNPVNATIPQYNFRIGYYFHDHWDISFGIDHMKYVVNTGQTVGINGEISETNGQFDGVFENDNILITNEFLLFEHTDGLNYGNLAIRRTDKIFEYRILKLNLTEGIGAGIILPKTNTTLFGMERYDEFHLSGYGIDGTVSLNLTFFDRFFIQSEVKGGYINLPDIRTTQFESDSANQSFFFSQVNILFGWYINLSKSSKRSIL